MSVHVSRPLKGVHTFHRPGEHPHLRATRCLGQVPSPPSCRSLHTQRRSRRLSVRGAGVTWAEKQRGHSPGRGHRRQSPGAQGCPPLLPGCCGEEQGAGPPRHSRLLQWGGEAEAPPAAVLLLRQCFKRRFWLPLHFVRNLILSVCAVCSQHAYRVEARGAGAEEHLLSGAQSAGCEPEPRQRTGSPAPAWPTPVGSGSSTRGGSPSPRTRTPPSTLPARAALHLRLGVEVGRSLLRHQRLGCGWLLPCRQQQTG